MLSCTGNISADWDSQRGWFVARIVPELLVDSVKDVSIQCNGTFSGHSDRGSLFCLLLKAHVIVLDNLPVIYSKLLFLETGECMLSPYPAAIATIWLTWSNFVNLEENSRQSH